MLWEERFTTASTRICVVSAGGAVREESMWVHNENYQLLSGNDSLLYRRKFHLTDYKEAVANIFLNSLTTFALAVSTRRWNYKSRGALKL